MRDLGHRGFRAFPGPFPPRPPPPILVTPDQLPRSGDQRGFSASSCASQTRAERPSRRSMAWPFYRTPSRREHRIPVLRAARFRPRSMQHSCGRTAEIGARYARVLQPNVTRRCYTAGHRPSCAPPVQPGPSIGSILSRRLKIRPPRMTAPPQVKVYGQIESHSISPTPAGRPPASLC